MSPGLGALPEDYSRLQCGLNGSGNIARLHGLHYMAPTRLQNKLPPLLSHPGGLMGRLNSDGSCCKTRSAHPPGLL